ncbi:MAG: FAD binding domain-containing protein, partial [Thermomicrobiales bacterium]
WYFRNNLIDCWLKGGEECPARGGENQLHALFATGPCVAVHPSDLASSLVALDATIQVRGSNGDRTIPASEFFSQPKDGRRRETTLGEDELVLSVTVPPLADGARNTYLKAMDRKVWAFALVGVAVSLHEEDGKIAAAHVVLGGVAPVPWRCPDAEQVLNGASPSPELFSRAADAALQGAKPMAHNSYKVPLAKGLVKQALERVISG